MSNPHSLLTESATRQPTRQSILQRSSADARAFLLKAESYCNLDFPPYIGLDALIDDVHKFLEGKRLSDLISKPRDHDDEKCAIAEKIKTRFERIPHTGYMQIWIQRVTHPFAAEMVFEEPICKLVTGEAVTLWNCDWISDKQLKDAIVTTKIIDRKELVEMDPVIPIAEVELFLAQSIDGYYG